MDIHDSNYTINNARKAKQLKKRLDSIYFIAFYIIYIVLFGMPCQYYIILFALYICIIVSIKNLNLIY